MQKILIVEDELIVATDLRLLLEKSGYNVCGIARSYQKAMEIINEKRPDIVFLDIFLKGSLTGIDVAKKLREENIAFIYLSANSSEEILTAAKITQPDGFLVKPYRIKDLFITLEIACYRHEHSQETTYRKEALFQKQLTQIAIELSGWQEKLIKICRAIQPFIPFDYIGAGTKVKDDAPYNMLSLQRTGFDEYQVIGNQELLNISHLKINELTQLQMKTVFHREPILYDEASYKELCSVPGMNKMLADAFNLKSHLAMPLTLPGGQIFFFFFYSRRPNAYSIEHMVIFNRLQTSLRTAVENMIAFEKRAPFAKNRNTTDNTAHVNSSVFDGIIGSSHLLLNVFDQIMQVAPADTSVLILGESGTGKERIAHSIHNLSPRKWHPLVKVNCAALPSNLIESELFGHEKGSFTGAYEKRIGKFEQADTGTIFLDEIGEMPMELQVKLLRVLQEKEIERIGSKAPIELNVRIIAATSRNLEKEVAEGRFRLDLYYRLNTFPIELPALRKRKEDIPSLVDYFINFYNQKFGNSVTGITDKALKILEAYNWPGNIRELEHVIERSILTAKSNLIEDLVLPKYSKELQLTFENNQVKTIHENERDHIISVLKKSKGRIWGAGGAAELLNVPPTTLNSKIKKLGIKKE